MGPGRVFAEHELLLLSREQLDICDNDQVQEVIGAARPDVVINTAAFVRVDDAEGEIAQSFAVNAGGPGRWRGRVRTAEQHWCRSARTTCTGGSGSGSR